MDSISLNDPSAVTPTKTRRTRRAVDPGLQQIDDLERLIATGRPRAIVQMGGTEEEAERARPEAERLAAAVCGRLRDEYLARRQPRT
jgi:hypothetical protein